MGRVLGLDISTTTGAVVASYDYGVGPVLDEAITITGKKGSRGMIRASEIAGDVLVLMKKWEPLEAVVIEGYGYANRYSLVTLVEIGTVIRYFVLQTLGSYYEVPPSVLKKFVTGAGNANKNMMMMHVYKRWGWEFKSDDQADASGLACMGLAGLNDISTTKNQRDALDKMVKINCN